MSIKSDRWIRRMSETQGMIEPTTNASGTNRNDSATAAKAPAKRP